MGRSRWIIVVLLVGMIVPGTIGTALFVYSHRLQPKTVDPAFIHAQHSLSFPIYIPRTIPQYYFIDTGSMTSDGNTLIFPITRNDGKKIIVTEQPANAGLSLHSINGLQHEIAGVGTIVVGRGFLSQRAVLETTKTFIFFSAQPDISIADLEAISYSFTQVNL